MEQSIALKLFIILAGVVAGLWALLVAFLPEALEGDFALPGRIDTRPVVDRDALERLVLIFGEV